MGNIIKFPGVTMHTSGNTCVMPPKEVIRALFSLMHGIGEDFYEVLSFRYEDGEATPLGSGAISTEDNTIEVADMRAKRIRFQAEARLIAERVRDSIKADKYYFYDDDKNGSHYVFIAGKDNFYSFGWCDSQKGAFKGAIMALLLAYSFAYINVSSPDKQMIKTAFDLLYAGRTGPLTELQINYAIESHRFHCPNNSPAKRTRIGLREIALVN